MKPAIKPWSPDEEAILRETYPRGHRAAAAALPHRSLNAIFHRAQKLELYTHRPWTRRDDAQLVDYWNEGFLGLATIAKKLGRTVGATYERSKVLGLPAGVPPGFETMSSAAARTGYNTTQLRMVLGWASVRVHRGLSRPTGKKKRSHYVSPEDVDDAVGEWLKTEPIESAARRHGLCGETLAKWLRDAGVEWRIMRGTRRHRRVRSVDVDRVVAERGLFSSLKENAKRLGIGRETLAKWLLAAGFSPGRKPIVARLEAWRTHGFDRVGAYRSQVAAERRAAGEDYDIGRDQRLPLLIERIESLPDLSCVEVVSVDARLAIPRAGAFVLLDPPYRGTTSVYQYDLPRASVLSTAERWRSAGCVVAVCEAEPLPLVGWHHHELPRSVGRGRTFSKQQREVLTISRPAMGQLALGGCA